MIIKSVKNIAKKVCVGALVATMMVSVGGVASAAVGYETYSFRMKAQGGTDRSISEEKVDAGVPAYVNISKIKSYVNLSRYPLTTRVRTSTGEMATEKLDFSATRTASLNYLAGHGKNSRLYYLKMQTNSNSAYDASVSGTWRP